MNEALTARQREVIDTITRLTRENSIPPTIRDVGAAMGLASPNGIMGHLTALRKKGVIAKPDGRQKARGIVLINQTTCPHCGQEFPRKDATP